MQILIMTKDQKKFKLYSTVLRFLVYKEKILKLHMGRGAQPQDGAVLRAAT